MDPGEAAGIGTDDRSAVVIDDVSNQEGEVDEIESPAGEGVESRPAVCACGSAGVAPGTSVEAGERSSNRVSSGRLRRDLR